MTGGEQFDLFCSVNPAKALARRTDPETSKQAAQEILRSIRGMRKRAVDAVARWPGRTASELSDLLGDRDVRKVGRRLGECSRKNLIRRGRARACKVTGCHAATWYPIGADTINATKENA